MAIWPDQVMKRDARIAALEAENKRLREERDEAIEMLREARALLRGQVARLSEVYGTVDRAFVILAPVPDEGSD